MFSKRLLVVLVSVSVSGLLHAQYNPDNHVVTVSKYYLSDWRKAENGSPEERKEVFEEHNKKMNPLQTKLRSSMYLGHYWSGKSEEVLVVNEWASISDADETIRGTGDTRKKAWRKDEDREEFMAKYNKYWVGKHTDVAVHELNMKRVKRAARMYKENTFVTVVEYSLVPLSEVEDGSGAEREELMQAYFDNIVKKDDRIISYKELQHYWSGTSGGPHGMPLVVVTEYASVEDALDEDDSALWVAAWPDEEERNAFGSRLFAYWGYGVHKDLGLHSNWVNMSK